MVERQQDDEILIARAQEGDEGSFNALIVKHQQRAFNYAFRLTRNADEASDVVAESFVRVFNALGHFKGQSAFSTWLYRIMTNCYLDMKKRDKSKFSVSLDSAIQTKDGSMERQVEDTSPTPYVRMETTERQLSVQNAINALPEYQRAMVIMYHAENMSYEEISAALDLPLGTVKSRLNRARLNLRELLVKNEELFKQY
jgi:RNA polymerase sigma-70 factor (ECF subfamily)